MPEEPLSASDVNMFLAMLSSKMQADKQGQIGAATLRRWSSLLLSICFEADGQGSCSCQVSHLCLALGGFANVCYCHVLVVARHLCWRHQEDWLYCMGELFLDDQLVSSAAKGSKIAEEQEALRSIEFYEAPPMLGCKTDP